MQKGLWGRTQQQPLSYAWDQDPPAHFLFLTQCQALECCSSQPSNLETAVGMCVTEQDGLWTKVLKENQNGRLAPTPPLDSL